MRKKREGSEGDVTRPFKGRQTLQAYTLVPGCNFSIWLEELMPPDGLFVEE